MRSYCAVYVDAGYLLASAATRVTGTSLRSGIRVDHAKLIEFLVEQAERISGMPLLRVNWYDASSRRGGGPDPEQERIAMLPKVKVRLGRVAPTGEQKGVDLRIGLDLVNNARSGAVDIMYLLSGDDDLTEAVEEAQNHASQVVILGVPNVNNEPHAVSRHLQREADDMIVLDPVLLDAVITRAPAPVPADIRPRVTVEQEPGTATVPPEEEVELVSEGPAAPTPAMLAARARMSTPDPRRETGRLVYSSRTGDAPRGLGGQYGVDDFEAVDVVAGNVLESWLSSATPQDRARLLADRPSVPSDLDRVLLLDYSSRTGQDYLEEFTKHLLRHRFWEKVDERLTS